MTDHVSRPLPRAIWLGALAGALAGACAAPGESDPETTTSALIAPGTVLIDANFNAGTNGFSYADDVFKGTSAPAYATGSHAPTGGQTGDGALRVRLGNVDGATVPGMSGGWARSFTLAEPARITVQLKYNLIQSPHYEADEFGQVNASIDGTLFGHFAGADHLVQQNGDGEGGPERIVGWHSVNVNLGTFGAGTHTLRFGGFGNKKTNINEFQDVFIDDVRVIADPPPGAQTVLAASFDDGVDGFEYLPDAFKGTNAPAYSIGAFNPGEGFTGGAVNVNLGGMDEADIVGMSGGWRRSFTLPAAAQVTLSFRYNLAESGNFEADEFGQVNASIDGVLFGQVPGADHFVQFPGNGEGGGVRTIGWHNPTVNLGTLSAGTHVLTIGGFVNKKTAANEIMTATIDDVLVTAAF
jgi:hypothetical protein